MAFIHYKRIDRQLYYWRTNHGAEVDLLLCEGRPIVCVLEIKSSQNIAGQQLGGLKSFILDNRRQEVGKIGSYVVGNVRGWQTKDDGRWTKDEGR